MLEHEEWPRLAAGRGFRILLHAHKADAPGVRSSVSYGFTPENLRAGSKPP